MKLIDANGAQPVALITVVEPVKRDATVTCPLGAQSAHQVAIQPFPLRPRAPEVSRLVARARRPRAPRQLHLREHRILMESG